MPYYCPSHTGENASKNFAFISHNTFWMYGFVEHAEGEQSMACNCPEEFDVWEMVRVVSSCCLLSISPHNNRWKHAWLIFT